jgi:preprotein translocase subunit SecG
MSQAQVTALFWFAWAASLVFAIGALIAMDREACIFAAIFFGCALVLAAMETPEW